jgi:hypothetical protein
MATWKSNVVHEGCHGLAWFWDWATGARGVSHATRDLHGRLLSFVRLLCYQPEFLGLDLNRDYLIRESRFLHLSVWSSSGV